MQTCPQQGCAAKLKRSRDVMRDDMLRDALSAVPEAVDRVWVNDACEIRLEQPAEVSVSTGVASNGAAPMSIDLTSEADAQPSRRRGKRKATSALSVTAAPAPEGNKRSEKKPRL